eukprot:gnl/TRDRNA2_/TRDRNA2_29254_c0_seq1.p1 gnl/TRDRNA2_/TRDRNA2_29254_c0~~gnl/TRDRNA2_/TRDRNA2_29254_c0_seq1.p1  ORF type:complete len:339 (+),score=63.33 gnl/TRDRNA2_/TRDRNA2_29254_c0_seq1:19-1035(+)
MQKPDGLASLSAQEYLKHFDVEFYLRDLLSIFLSRRRDDSRSLPEFFSQYFDAVLKGQHVCHRNFEYVSSTPLNRRAFVLLLRDGTCGIDDQKNTALTPHDLHDFVVQLCADFPLGLVEEAAVYADRADGASHHLLGEALPFGQTVAVKEEAPNVDADQDLGTYRRHPAELGSLFVLSSLQRLVELFFVYREVVALVKKLFEHAAMTSAAETVNAAGSSVAGTGVVPRAELVAALRLAICDGGAMSSVAVPSESALMRLSKAGPPQVTIREAFHGMADAFDLALVPNPDALPSIDTSVTGPAAEEQASSPPAAAAADPARSRTSGAAAALRRRGGRSR